MGSHRLGAWRRRCRSITARRKEPLDGGVTPNCLLVTCEVSWQQQRCTPRTSIQFWGPPQRVRETPDGDSTCKVIVLRRCIDCGFFLRRTAVVYMRTLYRDSGWLLTAEALISTSSGNRFVEERRITFPFQLKHTTHARASTQPATQWLGQDKNSFFDEHPQNLGTSTFTRWQSERRVAWNTPRLWSLCNPRLRHHLVYGFYVGRRWDTNSLYPTGGSPWWTKSQLCCLTYPTASTSTSSGEQQKWFLCWISANFGGPMQWQKNERGWRHRHLRGEQRKRRCRALPPSPPTSSWGLWRWTSLLQTL